MSNANENWVIFHFESNQVWGTCKTKEEWDQVKKNYLNYWEDRGGLDLEKAMKSNYENGVPSFGFRSEHIGGTYSLAQFAIDNNMDL